MKFLGCKAGILAIVLFGSIEVVSACGVDWNVPVNHFDGVNEWGQLSYWREIGKMDLGDGLNIPLIIGFNPKRGQSPYLGKGWTVTVLESNIVQIDEKKFLLTQPDGIVRQFWRKKSTDAILEGQGGWKGEIKDSVINLWASCGWKLTFYKGKITSITTPKNRVLNLVYAKGKVSELRERGKTILRVDSDSDGRVKNLTYGTNIVGIELGDKPRVDVVKGLNVVGGIESSLHKLTLPNGRQVVYDYKVDTELQPMLKISGDTSKSFTWEPKTSRILKDGVWNYTVVPRNLSRYFDIFREDGQKKEHYINRTHEGIKDILQDGQQIITTYFASGKLKGKIRSSTNIDSIGKKVISKYNYLPDGKISRVVRSSGYVEEYTYSLDNPNRYEKVITASDGTKYKYYFFNNKLEKRIVPGVVQFFSYTANGAVDKILTKSTWNKNRNHDN